MYLESAFLTIHMIQNQKIQLFNLVLMFAIGNVKLILIHTEQQK